MVWSMYFSTANAIFSEKFHGTFGIILRAGFFKNNFSQRSSNRQKFFISVSSYNIELTERNFLYPLKWKIYNLTEPKLFVRQCRGLQTFVIEDC